MISGKKYPFLLHFEQSIEAHDLPERFTYPFEYVPHPLCKIAANELQNYLKTQTEWVHNFGLDENVEGHAICKMFGVLLVKTKENEIGYLAAFSGKLAGGNNHSKFVPPLFDGQAPGNFLGIGMVELARINKRIKNLKAVDTEASRKEISHLKSLRKNNSIALQAKLFDQYHFLNQTGKSKSLVEIFREAKRKPPSGAGECAAPKLLQYAFQHEMKPIAIAEFFWGKCDSSIHGQFYPSCIEKCQPILEYMLEGIEMDDKPVK